MYIFRMIRIYKGKDGRTFVHLDFFWHMCISTSVCMLCVSVNCTHDIIHEASDLLLRICVLHNALQMVIIMKSSLILDYVNLAM